MQTYYFGGVHNGTQKSMEQSLQDLCGNTKPFGSTLILLVGDFRQILPIIPKSTPADEIKVCLKNSNLWAHVKTLKLTINMRFRLQNDDSGQTFSDQLLATGNGKLPVVFIYIYRYSFFFSFFSFLVFFSFF